MEAQSVRDRKVTFKKQRLGGISSTGGTDGRGIGLSTGAGGAQHALAAGGRRPALSGGLKGQAGGGRLSFAEDEEGAG
jgi:hypothetical protein